jgi:hypothetical protein
MAMYKAIYVLAAPDKEDRLVFGERLRALGPELAALGALGLRLNVHDADVLPERSFEMSSAFGPFWGAVQIWLPDDGDASRKPHEACLAKMGVGFHGYLVDERPLVLNLANAPAPGERSQGYSLLSMLQIPPRLDREAWLRGWQGRHTWVALSIHPHLEYIQSPVIRAITPDAPPIEGFGEETFPIEGLGHEAVIYKAVDDPEKHAARQTASSISIASTC